MVAEKPAGPPAQDVAVLAPPLAVPGPVGSPEPEPQTPLPPPPLPAPALLVEEAARLVEEAAGLVEEAANLDAAVVVNLAAIPEPDVPDLLVAEARALDAPDLGLLEREAAEDIDLPPDLPEAPGQEPPEANVAGAVQVANVAGAAQVAEPAAVDEPAEKLLAIVVPETLAGIEVADNPGIAGLMAYRRGDYLTALANLLHGAVQGDPSAQFLLGGCTGTGREFRQTRPKHVVDIGIRPRPFGSDPILDQIEGGDD